jgi:hypothetical protein
MSAVIVERIGDALTVEAEIQQRDTLMCDFPWKIADIGARGTVSSVERTCGWLNTAKRKVAT